MFPTIRQKGIFGCQKTPHTSHFFLYVFIQIPNCVSINLIITKNPLRKYKKKKPLDANFKFSFFQMHFGHNVLLNGKRIICHYIVPMNDANGSVSVMFFQD